MSIHVDHRVCSGRPSLLPFWGRGRREGALDSNQPHSAGGAHSVRNGLRATGAGGLRGGGEMQFFGGEVGKPEFVWYSFFIPVFNASFAYFGKMPIVYGSNKRMILYGWQIYFSKRKNFPSRKNACYGKLLL